MLSRICLLSLTGFLLLTHLATVRSSLTQDQLEKIDELINDLFIPRNNVTGVSLSVFLEGETVLSKGYGRENIEEGIDSTNVTLFAIGSVTKSFTSVLVVKKLSEIFPFYGEQVLDMPIVTLDPNFNLTFSDRFRAEQTSFRDLLSHRTCLYNADLELLFGNIKTSHEYSYRTRYQTQGCGFRSGWIYNNSLYALAGEIIASLAGIPFHDMMRSFMAEIGMSDSTTIDKEGSYENLPRMSQAYYQLDGQIHKYNQKLLRRVGDGLGAGGILSTANDMAKYTAFHLNKGKVGDTQVVSAEAMAWLYKPAISIGSIPGRDSEAGGVYGNYAYGLGLLTGLHDGYQLIWHNGYWPPFESGFYLFPAKNMGIFLSTNGPGVMPTLVNNYLVAASIFKIITSPDYKMPIVDSFINSPAFLLEEFQPAIKRIRHPGKRISNKFPKIEFEEAVGIYGDRTSGDLMITLDPEDNSFLQVNVGEWGIGRLIPVPGSTTKFTVEWKTDIIHDFYTYPTPIPLQHVEFQSNTVHLLSDDILAAVYVKNATLDTFPVIPWDPESCGPE